MAVGEATTNSIIECLNICQDNNVFVFLDKLYRQVSGHATGQKQAPSVACQGAGRVERRALNTPRDIVFNNNQTGRILSVDKDDPIFWSVRDLLDWFRDTLMMFCACSEEIYNKPSGSLMSSTLSALVGWNLHSNFQLKQLSS